MLKSRLNPSRPQQKQQQQQQHQQNLKPLQSNAPDLEPNNKKQSFDDLPASKMTTATDVRQKSSARSGHPGSRGQTSNSRTGGGNNKQAKYMRFNLHSANDESLNSAIEYVSRSSINRFRTCVVTIISKDSLDESMRDHLVQNILASNYNPNSKTGKRHPDNDFEDSVQATTCQQHEKSKEDNEYDTQVIGHADFDNGLVVLTLDSFMNTSKLIDLSDSILNDFHKKPKEHSDVPVYPLLDAWPEWNQNLIKTLLILFTMSHVIVFYNPEPSIDYSLIGTLKVLEVLRMKSISRISDFFETIAASQIFSQQWIRNCRISCPRALFICDISYLDINIDGGFKVAQIRDELEEQIYLLLKKSNLLHGTRFSLQKPLFCLPDQDDFVFIIERKDLNLLGISNRQQVEERDSTSVDSIRCLDSLQIPEKQASNSGTRYESQDVLTTSMQELKIEDIPSHGDVRKFDQNQLISRRHNRLCRFMNRHISDIRASVVHDHDNKQKQQQSTTILPRFDDYFNVLLRLKCLLFPSQLREEQTLIDQKLESCEWPARDERRFVDIYDLLATDDLFSQRHCYRARLAAFELYARGLQGPTRDEEKHLNSWNSALQYYTNQARGSAYLTNLKHLEDECNRHWLEVGPSSRNQIAKDRPYKSGSGKFVARTISSDSTSAKSPTHQTHRGFDRNNDNMLSISRRPNGVIVTAGCECGRESSLLIKPNDRKKKLERVDIYRIND